MFMGKGGMMFSVVLFLLFTAAIPHTYALETEFPVDPTSRESFAQPEEMGVSVFAVEPQNKQIVCFDVADEGCIALGLKDPMDPDMGFVSIYTDEGLFLEGFQFKCYGSFYVEVLSNRVNIYCLRGDYLMSIPFTAGACERWSVKNKEVTPFLRNLKSANRSRNGIEYIVEKDVPLLYNEDEYSRLSIQKPTGERTIIYDASIYLNRIKTARIMLFVLLSVITLIALVSYILKERGRWSQTP